MKKSKKKWLGIIPLILGIIVVWGLVEPFFFDVEEEQAAITNLPTEWEGKEIAVVGDFQLGMWMDNDSTMKKIVDHLIELNPAAVLLTGDYIYDVHSADDAKAEEVINILESLANSKIPVYGVLGNHDYALKKKDGEPNETLANDLSEKLSDIGVTMLNNESATLSAGEDTDELLYIVGIGSEWAGKADPEEAFNNVPANAPRMVLMHNPDTFKDIENEWAPASVAGHTHGGQIRVPFTRSWSYLTLLQEGEVTIDGWIHDYGAEENNLYVNRGVGMSLLPMRVLSRPEITVFTLNNSK